MQLHHVINILIVGNLARGHVPVKQPAFKSFPMSIKSVENETVFLPCVVENLGESFIRWWKGDELISDSSIVTMLIAPRITVMNDGMTIESVEAEDSGEYTCEIVRPKPWSSLKQAHKILVLYPPKIFPTPSDGYLEVVLGEKVTMGCSVKGMPPPAVLWRTKGLVVPAAVEGRERLEFTASSHLMSGIYQCEADNGIGQPVHRNILLRVLHKPEVAVDKSWVHSAPGIKTVLVCRVQADPEAQVQWLLEGRPLRPAPPRVAPRPRGASHALHFSPLEASDFGNYTCAASNRLGAAQASMRLSGAANPVVIKKVEGKSGEEFSLIWEVESISPIFDYKLLFRKAGSAEWASFVIPADSSSSGPLHSKSYTFSGLDKLSVYEAKIFARNRFGWSDSSKVVTFGLTKSTSAEGKHLHVPKDVRWYLEIRATIQADVLFEIRAGGLSGINARVSISVLEIVLFPESMALRGLFSGLFTFRPLLLISVSANLDRLRYELT